VESPHNAAESANRLARVAAPPRNEENCSNGAPIFAFFVHDEFRRRAAMAGNTVPVQGKVLFCGGNVCYIAAQAPRPFCSSLNEAMLSRIARRVKFPGVPAVHYTQVT
jgi:hypothetical protein